MSMLKFSSLALILCFILSVNPALSSETFTENPNVTKLFRNIKAFQFICGQGGDPDRNYLIIESHRLNAVPSLLKEIVDNTDDSNNYVYVASCLIERITDKYNRLNWKLIYAPIASYGAKLQPIQRQQFQRAIIMELKNKSVLDCHYVDKDIVCYRK